ncbi:MAG TPA: methyltransferase [Burkholderiaceae bacterium]
MSNANQVDLQAHVRNLLMAFVASRALQVAAELGLADALAAGPKDRDALAREVGADAEAMSRLIRALSGYGVFDELPDGRFVNTRGSEYLRTDVPGSLRALARMHFDPSLWQAWTGLEHSVRSGEPSFAYVHGSPMFDYLATHPESARRFDEGMTSASGVMNAALVEAYEWGRFATLVDVAGGAGSTIVAILGANPGLRGVLFDLPHVIERGRDYVAQQGMAARCRTEAGSFFDSIPAGADAYLLKHIIHDWDDEDCLRILRTCSAAMPDRATLLVCERLVPPGNEPGLARIMDLVMLALTDGGRERTEQEFRGLFARAGLRLARVVPTRIDYAILVLTK